MPRRDLNNEAPPLVLHVIHHLVTGGMENGLVNLVNTMPESSYRHAIVCIEDYSAFRDRIRRQGVQVFALNRSRVGIWRTRCELFALFRRLRPAIIHSRNMSGLDAIVPAMLAGVRHRLHGEHGWDVGDLRGERFKPALLRRLNSPFVSRYVTVSRDLAGYLESRVGIAATRITQICNGVDTDRFVPAGDGPRRSRLPPAFRDENCVLIGTVGRIQPVKDQTLLLRAFAIAREMHPALRNRMRLAVVGDGPLLGELHALADSLGIAGETWLPGALDNVPEVLRAFDLFVLPSLNEGISNTILEALASGVPVVATNVGGNPELIDDGVTGRLIAAGDLDTLVRTIGEYAADGVLRRRQSEVARRVAIERFSLAMMVGRYEALYDHLTLGRQLPA